MNAKLQEANNNKPLPIWKRLTMSHRWAGDAEVPLMMRLGRTSHLVSQALEQALDFNPSHIRILFAALEPEGVTQSSLSKLYKVDPAAITRSIQAMERDDLIYRAPDPTDNRCMRIFVTEKGKALALTMPGKIATFELMLTEGLKDEEIVGLHRVLSHLEDRLTTRNTGLFKKEGKALSNESDESELKQ